MGDMSELEHVYGFQNTLYIEGGLVYMCVCVGLCYSVFCSLFFLFFFFVPL